jgi:hypothetical protein
MYGVAVCPKCHRAKGVALSCKTAQCSHCGHSIDITKARIYHRTDSQQELAAVMKIMTEKLAVRIEDFPAERKKGRNSVPKKRTKVHMNEDDLRSLAARLTKEKGSFELKDVLIVLGVSDLEAQLVLEKMLDHGIIYESKPEHFKAL